MLISKQLEPLSYMIQSTLVLSCKKVIIKAFRPILYTALFFQLCFFQSGNEDDNVDSSIYMLLSYQVAPSDKT